MRGDAEPAAREVERLAVHGGEPKQGWEVWAGPQPIHIRLAGARLTVGEDPGEYGEVVDPNLPGTGGRGVAEVP